MAPLKSAIPIVRESIVAVLGIKVAAPSLSTQPGPVGVQAEISWGSAFCFVRDRYLLTAFHVLNGGKAVDPAKRFYALAVPGNANPFFAFPVISVPFERPDMDIAVLELGPCNTPGVHLPALPVSFDAQADGTQVLTMGFPAPEIHQLGLDPSGNFTGGQFFLKSHANTGIVAANYAIANGHLFYELSVGWHHGESGGVIATVSGKPAAFSLMQHYRNVQSPQGILAGPRRGVALGSLRAELMRFGATEA